MKFWVNLHVKFSSFEPLLRKLYLITALINAEQKFLQNTSRKLLVFRSSRSKMFLKIGVLKNFANLTEKHLCWSLLLIQTLLDSVDSVKKRLQHRCYLVKFAKFLKTLFFIEHVFTVTVSPSGTINKSHVGRQQLYQELDCRSSRGNFSERAKQYPQLFMLLSWAL